MPDVEAKTGPGREASLRVRYHWFGDFNGGAVSSIREFQNETVVKTARIYAAFVLLDYFIALVLVLKSFERDSLEAL